MYPVLFTIGGFPVGSYGVILLLVYILALAVWIPLLARWERLDRKEVAWDIVGGAFAAVICAKLLAAMISLREYIDRPSRMAELLTSGGVLYGAIIGGLGYMIWLTLYRGISPLKYLDIALLIGTASVAVGRWGCFLSGCCFGRPTTLPWGVHFGNPTAHQLHPNLPDRSATGEPIYLHPTQIYDSLNMAIITVVLLLFYRRKKTDGEVACLGLILYGIGRSVVETFRGDAIRGSVFGLVSTSQFIGGVLTLAAAIGWVLLRRRAARPSPAPARTAGKRGGPARPDTRRGAAI